MMSVYVPRYMMPVGRYRIVFLRPSLRRDVLWYTNVRLSVRPFHMSRYNLRTP